MYKLGLQAAVCLFFALPMTAKAAEEDWVVAKATAQVKFSTDQTNWHAVKVGMTIPNGAWMSTGPRARALLQRGVESVNFHPGTVASITTNDRHETEVVQPTGMLDLDIEKRAAPHTRVDTPYLAAIVKGTKFSVTVSAKTADVSVSRGLVNVRSLQSSQQADVGPGQSASVGSAGGMQTAGKVAAPAISRVTSMFGFLGVPTTSALAAPAVSAATSTDTAAASSDPSAAASGGPSAGNGKGASSSSGSDGGRGSGNSGNSEKGRAENRDNVGRAKGPDKADGPDKAGGPENGPGPGKGPAGPGHAGPKDAPQGKGNGRPGGHGDDADNRGRDDDGGHGGKGPHGKGGHDDHGRGKGRDK